MPCLKLYGGKHYKNKPLDALKETEKKIPETRHSEGRSKRKHGIMGVHSVQLH